MYFFRFEVAGINFCGRRFCEEAWIVGGGESFCGERNHFEARGMGKQVLPITVGLDRTVVSIVHCGCTDLGSIPSLDKFCLFQIARALLPRNFDETRCRPRRLLGSQVCHGSGRGFFWLPSGADFYMGRTAR